MSNRELAGDEVAVDLFLKTMMMAPTRTNMAHKVTAYRMLWVDSGWYLYSTVGVGIGDTLTVVGTRVIRAAISLDFVEEKRPPKAFTAKVRGLVLIR